MKIFNVLINENKSNVTYIKASNIENYIDNILFLYVVDLVKFKPHSTNLYLVAPFAVFFYFLNDGGSLDNLSALCIEWDKLIISPFNFTKTTVKDLALSYDLNGTTIYDIIMSFPQLTEEEFYTIAE